MIPAKSYSWSEFGREAEFIVASYMKLKGWNISLSPSSRGAADIVARKKNRIWCIQVKASLKSPHIKSQEISRLKKYAAAVGGDPVFATLQPWHSDQYGMSLGSYMIFLYSLDNWTALLP